MKRRDSGTTVILADGGFPSQATPLKALFGARRIICCDGAASKLVKAGREPTVVVGDGDSISGALRERLADRMVLDDGQEDNDLSKAFRYCLRMGWRDLTIMGATGLREDHTLGNISLLVDFAREAKVEMLTDHGIFTPLLSSGRMATRPGQPVSIFSFDPVTAVSSRGLRYPLKGLRMTRWWQATLNSATGRRLELSFAGGPLLVYRAYIQ